MQALPSRFKSDLEAKDLETLDSTFIHLSMNNSNMATLLDRTKPQTVAHDSGRQLSKERGIIESAWGGKCTKCINMADTVTSYLTTMDKNLKAVTETLETRQKEFERAHTVTLEKFLNTESRLSIADAEAKDLVEAKRKDAMDFALELHMLEHRFAMLHKEFLATHQEHASSFRNNPHYLCDWNARMTDEGHRYLYMKYKYAAKPCSSRVMGLDSKPDDGNFPEASETKQKSPSCCGPACIAPASRTVGNIEQVRTQHTNPTNLVQYKKASSCEWSNGSQAQMIPKGLEEQHTQKTCHEQARLEDLRLSAPVNGCEGAINGTNRAAHKSRSEKIEKMENTMQVHHVQDAEKIKTARNAQASSRHGSSQLAPKHKQPIARMMPASTLLAKPDSVGLSTPPVSEALGSKPPTKDSIIPAPVHNCSFQVDKQAPGRPIQNATTFQPVKTLSPKTKPSMFLTQPIASHFSDASSISSEASTLDEHPQWRGSVDSTCNDFPGPQPAVSEAAPKSSMSAISSMLAKSPLQTPFERERFVQVLLEKEKQQRKVEIECFRREAAKRENEHLSSYRRLDAQHGSEIAKLKNEFAQRERLRDLGHRQEIEKLKKSHAEAKFVDESWDMAEVDGKEQSTKKVKTALQKMDEKHKTASLQEKKTQQKPDKADLKETSGGLSPKQDKHNLMDPFQSFLPFEEQKQKLEQQRATWVKGKSPRSSEKPADERVDKVKPVEPQENVLDGIEDEADVEGWHKLAKEDYESQ